MCDNKQRVYFLQILFLVYIKNNEARGPKPTHTQENKFAIYIHRNQSKAIVYLCVSPIVCVCFIVVKFLDDIFALSKFVKWTCLDLCDILIFHV